MKSRREIYLMKSALAAAKKYRRQYREFKAVSAESAKAFKAGQRQQAEEWLAGTASLPDWEQELMKKAYKLYKRRCRL